MSITVYGIANCSTMKKAFAWLHEHGVAYVFHDYKKAGVPETALRHWAAERGWEALINRRGTTWRRLSEAQRAVADADAAIALMLANPSLIRRPIVQRDDDLLLGFDPEEWAARLQGR
ncbi:ArsC family reductase [Acidithiobacillus sp. YTS05]|nr:ArsC family reductase [Acidithiobacillus sp. YTS05]